MIVVLEHKLLNAHRLDHSLINILQHESLVKSVPGTWFTYMRCSSSNVRHFLAAAGDGPFATAPVVPCRSEAPEVLAGATDGAALTSLTAQRGDEAAGKQDVVGGKELCRGVVQD